MIDDGIHVSVLTDQKLFRYKTDYRRVVGFTSQCELVGSDGICYLVNDGNLNSLDYSDSANLTELNAFDIVSQTICPNGWLGIDSDGWVKNSDGLQEVQLGSSEVWHFTSSDVSCLIAGKDAIHIKEECWRSIRHQGISQASRFFWLDGSYWHYQELGNRAVIDRISSQHGVESQTPGAIANVCSIVAIDSSSVYLVPVNEGAEMQKVNLESKETKLLEGVRTAHARPLDVVGIKTPKGHRILSAGTTAGQGKALLLDPETGATITFHLPTELTSGWKRAQWLVQNDSVLLAVSTENNSAVLEFRC